MAAVDTEDAVAVPASATSSGAVSAIGPRVRALREAMALSLRDLAERTGVSAPMLSQVERSETSPTVTVAARIASGLDLTLSQLLRLDETDGVAIVRAEHRLAGGAPESGHRYEVLTPAIPGSGLRSRSTRSRLARPPAAPATRRSTSPAVARRRWSPWPRAPRVCRRRTRARVGRRGHLRRRPSAPLREPRTGRRPLPGRRRGRTAEELEAKCRRPCSTRSGRRTRWRPASSTSISTSCTRSPRHRPSRAFVSPAAAYAGRTARSPPPITTCPPTHPRSPRTSPTTCPASRSRRSSGTAASSGSRSTRWAPPGRASCT